MDKSKGVIKPIENQEERQRVFERLSKELLAEAAALSSETGAEIGVVGFTPDGKTFNFGSSSDGAIFDRPISAESVNKMIEANKALPKMEIDSDTESEDEDDDDDDEQQEEKTDGFWWEKIDIEKLDTREKVEAVKKALLEVRKEVSNEKRQKLASASATRSTGQQQ